MSSAIILVDSYGDLQISLKPPNPFLKYVSLTQLRYKIDV